MEELLNRENQIPIRLWMFIVFTAWVLFQGFVLGFLVQAHQTARYEDLTNKSLAQTQRCINGFGQCTDLLKVCRKGGE